MPALQVLLCACASAAASQVPHMCPHVPLATPPRTETVRLADGEGFSGRLEVLYKQVPAAPHCACWPASLCCSGMLAASGLHTLPWIDWLQVWGSVCSDGWTSVQASVACKQLGAGGTGTVVGGFGPSPGPIWLGGVVCQGDEETLQDCQHRPWNDPGCDHSKDVAIACSGAWCICGAWCGGTVQQPCRAGPAAGKASAVAAASWSMCADSRLASPNTCCR